MHRYSHAFDDLLRRANSDLEQFFAEPLLAREAGEADIAALRNLERRLRCIALVRDLHVGVGIYAMPYELIAYRAKLIRLRSEVANPQRHTANNARLFIANRNGCA